MAYGPTIVAAAASSLSEPGNSVGARVVKRRVAVVTKKFYAVLYNPPHNVFGWHKFIDCMKYNACTIVGTSDNNSHYVLLMGACDIDYWQLRGFTIIGPMQSVAQIEQYLKDLTNDA